MGKNMDDINGLDLNYFVSTAIAEVFETMLSIDLKELDSDCRVEMEGNTITGTVSFAGKIMGNFNFVSTEKCARMLTVAMLGMEENEIEGQEEINDVIGELSNMIGGDIKSRFCDSGFETQLSIPSITSGSDYKIQTRDFAKKERYIFEHKEHKIIVEIFIKPGG